MRIARPTTHSYEASGAKIENIQKKKKKIHEFAILQEEFSLK